MLNLTIAFFNQTQLLPSFGYGAIESTESIDNDGNIQNTNQSLSYKIRYWSGDSEHGIQNYLTNVQNNELLYLQSGGDFIKGLYIFYETFIKGVILVRPTLMNFGLPSALTWYFVIPVYFLYTLAVIQMITGKSFESR